ncbi:hypothetical protein [Ekhidna sp.]|uniref:hypothetical protein n=1 Tax=Ekhidna sp. TaxID=2608089 RepID=UPI003511942B
MNIALKSILVLSILITSCGDDDSSFNLPLVGTTWTETSIETKDCPDSSDSYFEECTEDCDVMIFNSDGTISYPNVGQLDGVLFEYEINGDQMTIIATIGETTISESAAYSIVGNVLTFTLVSETTNCTKVIIYHGS